MGIKSPVSSTVNFGGSGGFNKVAFGTTILSRINFNGSLLWEPPVIELYPEGSTSIYASTVANSWNLWGAPPNTTIVYYLLPSGEGAIGCTQYAAYTPYGSNIVDVTTTHGAVHRLCTITAPGTTTDWSFIVWESVAVPANTYTGAAAYHRFSYIGVNSAGQLRSGQISLTGGTAASYTTTLQVVNAATTNFTYSIVETVPSFKWGYDTYYASTYDAATNIGMKFY